MSFPRVNPGKEELSSDEECMLVNRLKKRRRSVDAADETTRAPKRRRLAIDLTDDQEDVPDLILRESDDGWSEGDWSDDGMGISSSTTTTALTPKDHLTANVNELHFVLNQKKATNEDWIFSHVFAMKSEINESVGASTVCLGIRLAKIPSMTREQLAVWNIGERDEFLVIRLRISPFYLNDSVPPAIEIGLAESIDSKQLRPFCLGWTIQDRLRNGLLAATNWPPHLDTKMSGAQHDLSTLEEVTWQSYGRCIIALEHAKHDWEKARQLLQNKHELTRVFRDMQPNISEDGTIQFPRPQKDERDDEKRTALDESHEPQVSVNMLEDYERNARNVDLQVSQLVEMFGANQEVVMYGIQKHGYNVVLEVLLNQQLHRLEAEMQQESQTAPPRPPRPPQPRGYQPQPRTPTTRTTSTSQRAPRSKKRSHRKRPQPREELPMEKPVEEITYHVGTDVKLALLCKHNFLVRVLCFVWQSIEDGNKRCMICHDLLPFAALKPTICDKELCSFQQLQIGLGFSLAHEITTRPGIVDLLITLFCSGCRARRIAVASPHVIRLTGSGETMPLDRFEDDELADKLLGVLTKIESTSVLNECAMEGEAKLKKHLNDIDPLAYGLLCWIVTSNRCHLRKLTYTEKIPGLNPSMHQFGLCSATPEKEAQFQKYKAKYGSFFAFHGSPIGNWHAILRIGLKNYSGSKYQMHGKAYGSGIYLAERLKVSVVYSLQTPFNGWGESMYGKTKLFCFAICEVVDHPSIEPQRYREENGGGMIWVVENEQHIITRFFIVCDPSGVNPNDLVSSSITAQNLKIPDVVNAV